jgi:DNA-binding transcriptional ArsR family regulator
MLAKDNLEEETYSTIFTSLKHPIRRRILRMLSEKPLSFSEILEALKIDSGHLSYHLENLGDIAVRTQEGKYQLSSIGNAAVKLMRGVEEQPKTSQKIKPRQIIARTYPIFLAISLILASLTIAIFTVPVSSAILNQDNQSPLDFTIGAGETFEFALKLGRWAGPLPVGSTFGGTYLLNASEYNWAFLAPHEANRPSAVAKQLIWLDLWFNFSTVMPSLANALPVELPNTLSVKVHMPDGSETAANIFQAHGAVEDATDLWTWGAIEHYVSNSIEAYELGNYRFVITNNGSYDWAGTMMPYVQWQQLEKPYFYYGIAGIVIASTYLLFSITELKTNRSPKQT